MSGRRSPDPRDGASRVPVLNPTLYGLLRERFGRVKVSKPGEPAIPGPPRYSPMRNCFETTFIDEGEYYHISCPYCNDTRQRLDICHLWCSVDPLNDRPLWHMATCHNEGCLRANYRDFHDRVFGPISQGEREALAALYSSASYERGDPATVDDGPVAPPGTIVPLDELPRGHVASAYLRDRGFDVVELARDWGVGYCARVESRHWSAEGRVYVPVVMDDTLVTWQARWPGDDWKQRGVPKYYNLPGASKSHLLYNRDRALEHAAVVVVEGVTDAWAVGGGAVALLGKTVSATQLDLLRAWSDGLCVLMLDAGAWTTEARDPAAAKVKHDLLLAELGEVFARRVVEIILPAGRDPGQFDRATLSQLVRDEVRAAGFKPRKYGL